MARHSDPWFAWTLVLAGVLLLTNAAWFYNWRVRAVEHAEALAAAMPKAERQERVVYEYVQSPAQAAPRRHRQPQRRVQATRDLVPGEECRGGVIIRRSPGSIESTGERCRQ